MTYGTSCHNIARHVLPNQAFLGKQNIFLELASILRMCLGPTLNLRATSLINISGVIFIYVDIRNGFTCIEEISKLAVLSSKKYHLSQSAANLSI